MCRLLGPNSQNVIRLFLNTDETLRNGCVASICCGTSILKDRTLWFQRKSGPNAIPLRNDGERLCSRLHARNDIARQSRVWPSLVPSEMVRMAWNVILHWIVRATRQRPSCDCGILRGHHNPSVNVFFFCHDYRIFKSLLSLVIGCKLYVLLKL